MHNTSHDHHTPEVESNNVPTRFYWIIDHEELDWAPGLLVQELENEMYVHCVTSLEMELKTNSNDEPDFYSIDMPGVPCNMFG